MMKKLCLIIALAAMPLLAQAESTTDKVIKRSLLPQPAYYENGRPVYGAVRRVEKPECKPGEINKERRGQCIKPKPEAVKSNQN